jgi:hypothetical protein
MLRLARTLRRRLAGERGSLLIEAVITSAILLTVSAGVFLALATAHKQSGVDRSKALATDVAQGQLDTLRTRDYNDLRTLNETTTVQRGATIFTVVSTATATSQTDAPSGCSNQRARDYLRLNATVSWNSMGARTPVSLTTLVAAPVGAGGGLIASVLGGAGQGISGIPLTLAPTGGTATTDASGCARWDSLPAATGYTMTASASGYVTPNGDQDVSISGISVAAEQTATSSFAYDRGGAVALRFTQMVTGSILPVPVDAAFLPDDVTLTNSSATVDKPFAPDFPTATTRTLANAGGQAGLFFPYPATAYSAYADSCVQAQPPAVRMPSMLITGGATARNGAVPYDVLLPSLNIKVTSASAAAPAATTTVSVLTPCNTKITGLKIGADGTLVNPGLPYGTGYKVCASDSATGRRTQVTGVANTAYAVPLVATPTTVNMTSGGTACSF